METLQPLTAALRAHRAPRLRALNLAWNRIADARPLAAALAEGAAPLLSELKLDGNQLPDASAAALAAAFAGGAAPGLETLVLGTDRAGNLIGDEGMLALVDALCRGLPQLARRRAPSPPPQHAARTRPPPHGRSRAPPGCPAPLSRAARAQRELGLANNLIGDATYLQKSHDEGVGRQPIAAESIIFHR